MRRNRRNQSDRERASSAATRLGRAAIMLIATWMLATPSAAWADEAALPRHGVGIDAMQLYDGNVRLRYEYGLSPSLGVGAILGAGQPYRSQLDTFDTFEVGVHGAFYGVGDRTLGLELTAQLLLRHARVAAGSCATMAS